MPTEIYCPIDKQWSPVVGFEMVPPDVQSTVAECGHKLPTWAETRDVDEPEPQPKSKSKPTPPPAPPKNLEEEESDWEHSD